MIQLSKLILIEHLTAFTINNTQYCVMERFGYHFNLIIRLILCNFQNLYNILFK